MTPKEGPALYDSSQYVVDPYKIDKDVQSVENRLISIGAGLERFLAKSRLYLPASTQNELRKGEELEDRMTEYMKISSVRREIRPQALYVAGAMIAVQHALVIKPQALTPYANSSELESIEEHTTLSRYRVAGPINAKFFGVSITDVSERDNLHLPSVLKAFVATQRISEADNEESTVLIEQHMTENKGRYADAYPWLARAHIATGAVALATRLLPAHESTESKKPRTLTPVPEEAKEEAEKLVTKIDSFRRSLLLTLMQSNESSSKSQELIDVAQDLLEDDQLWPYVLTSLDLTDSVFMLPAYNLALQRAKQEGPSSEFFTLLARRIKEHCEENTAFISIDELDGAFTKVHSEPEPAAVSWEDLQQKMQALIGLTTNLRIDISPESIDVEAAGLHRPGSIHVEFLEDDLRMNVTFAWKQEDSNARGFTMEYDVVRNQFTWTILESPLTEDSDPRLLKLRKGALAVGKSILDAAYSQALHNNEQDKIKMAAQQSATAPLHGTVYGGRETRGAQIPLLLSEGEVTTFTRGIPRADLKVIARALDRYTEGFREPVKAQKAAPDGTEYDYHIEVSAKTSTYWVLCTGDARGLTPFKTIKIR